MQILQGKSWEDNIKDWNGLSFQARKGHLTTDWNGQKQTQIYQWWSDNKIKET